MPSARYNGAILRRCINALVSRFYRLYHPVKCAADAKLGALARGMAQGHNSMETMSTPARQDMLVGALEGFLEDLPSS